MLLLVCRWFTRSTVQHQHSESQGIADMGRTDSDGKVVVIKRKRKAWLIYKV